MEVNPNPNGGAGFIKENGTQSIDMSPSETTEAAVMKEKEIDLEALREKLKSKTNKEIKNENLKKWGREKQK
jgi:hypothetical protein